MGSSLAEERERGPSSSRSGRLGAAARSEFKDQLAPVIPHLRAFGRSLSGSRDLADDLVQETLLKAWAARKRFQAGTNMRAWTFIILRNLFLSQMRRARFKGEWDEITASKMLAAPASQDRHIELGDMQRALLHLPQPQREALILVGAGGFAYEEAAEICGCAVGTIKSRVARGRVALEQLLIERQIAVAPPASDGPRQDRAADHHGRGRRAQPRSRTRSRLPGGISLIQATQQVGEIMVAGLHRGRLEGAAKRGGDAGMRRGNVDLDDLMVHRIRIRRRDSFVFQLHLHCKRLVAAEVSSESHAKR